MKNLRCDGAGPCDMGEIRRLPDLSGDGASHLCIRCHGRESQFRRQKFKQRLQDMGQVWWNLKIVPDPNLLK